MENYDAVGIGTRMKNLRKMLSLKQIEMAARLGVSESAYNRYESGQREVKGSFIQLYKKISGVNLNWLFTGEGEMFDNSTEVPLTREDQVDLFIDREFPDVENRERLQIKKIIEEIHDPILRLEFLKASILIRKKYPDYFQENQNITPITGVQQ